MKEKHLILEKISRLEGYTNIADVFEQKNHIKYFKVLREMVLELKKIVEENDK